MVKANIFISLLRFTDISIVTVLHNCFDIYIVLFIQVDFVIHLSILLLISVMTPTTRHILQ